MVSTGLAGILFVLGFGLGIAIGWWARETVDEAKQFRPHDDIQRRNQSSGNSVGEPWV